MNINSITITRLYDQLSSKLGKETAENLITFIEQKVQDEVKENQNSLIIPPGAAGGTRGSVLSARERWAYLWEKAKWVALAIIIIEMMNVIGRVLFH